MVWSLCVLQMSPNYINKAHLWNYFKVSFIPPHPPLPLFYCRYILSLALADLLVIVTTVPLTSTVYTFQSWPYGSLLCTVSEFTKDVSIGVSVFTLTALSGDRFFAIVDPLRKFHIHSEYFKQYCLWPLIFKFQPAQAEESINSTRITLVVWAANIKLFPLIMWILNYFHVYFPTTGGGRRATRMTIATAVSIWILAIICGVPAILGSHLKVRHYFDGDTLIKPSNIILLSYL